MLDDPTSLRRLFQSFEYANVSSCDFSEHKLRDAFWEFLQNLHNLPLGQKLNRYWGPKVKVQSHCDLMFIIWYVRNVCL